MSEHDLRRRAQRITDLRRRYNVSKDDLTPDELSELQIGISEDEYREIIRAIRGERRSATPSTRTKKVEKEREASKPIDVFSFVKQETPPT